MRNPIKALVGTPEEHKKEKEDHQVVEAPEFDLTLYAKRLALVIPLIVAACVGVLEGLGVEKTEVMGIAIFGVVAAALLGVSVVMAADLVARAFVTGPGAAEKKEAEEATAPSDSELITAPPGLMVWLEDDGGPHPVLAIALDGAEASSYLVASGLTVPRTKGTESVEAIDRPPAWRSADKIDAVRATKWP